MSGQARTLPVQTGHPDSWSLRKDSVNNSSVCEVSENENWMNRSEGGCAGDEGGNFSRGIGAQTGCLDSRPAGICLRDSHQTEPVGTGDGGTRRKRHASVSHQGNHRPVPRKRRKTVDRSSAQPKFLMGGSIRDPLNLNSLCDEEVSRCLNAATPISSPLPHLNKDPNPVIVPADVRDPLQLNVMVGEEETEGATASLTRTLTPKAGGKKRKKRPDKLTESHSADEAVGGSSGGLNIASASAASSGKPAMLNLDAAALKLVQHSSAAKIPDKIVSPVLPADGSCGQAYRKRKKQCEPTAKIARALLVDSPTDSGPPNNDSPDKKPRERTTPEKRRYRRQTSREAKTLPPKFRAKDEKFQYGNYHRYYGYRNPNKEDDARIPYLRRKWFEGKHCLDIGCNSGHVTLFLAKNFAPERVTGIDIDGTLIGIARKNIQHCLAEEGRGSTQTKTFPTSMKKIYGPIASSAKPTPTVTPTTSKFPGNILFRCANFVPETDQVLELQRAEYDTVLCLSVTKWVHLNWGDAGLKRLFRRIYLALRPGGRFILEPQGWPSYTKKKKLTETIYKNFKQIQLKPDKFKDYLLSSHVGFSSCETIGTPLSKSKGFRRPIFMFTKLTTSREGASGERSSTTVNANQRWSATSSSRPRPHVTDPCRDAAPVEHRSNTRCLEHKPTTAPPRPGRDLDKEPPARTATEASELPGSPKTIQTGQAQPSSQDAETGSPRPGHESPTESGEAEIEGKEDREDPQGSRIDDLRVKGGDLQVKDGDPGVKDGDLQVEDDDLRVKDGDLQVKEGDLQVKEGDLLVKDGDLQVKDGDLQVKDDGVRVKDDSLEVRDDDRRVNDIDPLVKGDDFRVKDNDLRVREDEPEVKDEGLQVKDDDPPPTKKLKTEPV